MKRSKWKNPAKFPKKTGWYIRDYRSSGCAGCPPFAMDFYQVDPSAEFRAGYWYVHDDKRGGLNDAHYENLPWRKVKS